MNTSTTTPLPPDSGTTSKSVPIRPGGSVGKIVAIGFVAWLVMSVLFLYPIIGNPSLTRSGDDYWAFSEWFGSSEPYPHTYFGPFYPLFIRLMREFGLSVVAFIALQKVMVLASGYLIYRIGRHFGLSVVLAALAGAAYVSYPITQAQSSLLLAETFYLILALGGIACLLPALDARQSATLGSLVAGFALLGLAALARGNGLVLFAGVGLLALVRCPLRKVIVAGVMGALPILLWSTLNYQWYGHFKPTSSGDANIAASLVGPVYAKQRGMPRVSGPDVWIEGQWYEHYSNQFDYAKAVRAKAIDYALDHPAAVAIGNVEGWFRSLLGPARQDFILLFGPKGDVLTVLSAAVRAVLLLGLIAYALTGAWRRQPTFSVILAVVLLGQIVAAGAAGFARFGFPVDAFSTVALALAVAARARTNSVDRELAGSA